MNAKRLKQSAFGCLSLIFCIFAYWGLFNWLGSGPATRELKQVVSSVDAKQFQNESYNVSQVEKLEGELKDLRDELESLVEMHRNERLVPSEQAQTIANPTDSAPAIVSRSRHRVRSKSPSRTVYRSRFLPIPGIMKVVHRLASAVE